MFVRWTVLVFLLLYFHHKFNIVQVFLFVIHTDILLQGRLRQSNERIRYGTSGWVIVHLFLVPVIALIGWTTYALANYGMTYTGKTHSTSLGFISSFGYLLVRSSLLTDIYHRCQGDFPSLGYRRLQLKYVIVYRVWTRPCRLSFYWARAHTDANCDPILWSRSECDYHPAKSIKTPKWQKD